VNYFISDDASDTLEGIFQILAAATLFYVSSWLTSKSQSDRWMTFINDHLKGARESAVPGLALALTAFLAVIREGAETIVFFQALTAGATESVEKHAVAAGIVVASIALAITFVVLNRAAHRIPFGKFFFATSILLYGLAVVFIGQGIASFQESGWIGATFLEHVATIPMLGLYPTVQSIAAQLLLIVFAAAAMIIPHGSSRPAKPAREVAGHPEIRPT
jgi:high-affinity iron transporter